MLRSKKKRIQKKELKKLYFAHKGNCCKCGAFLASDNPLGSFFILDRSGNFYCSDCDSEFEDGDPRIVDFAW